MEIADLYLGGDKIEFVSNAKIRHNQKIQYKTTITNHGKYISVHKQMFINGALNGHSDLVHIPNNIIKDILKLTS